MNVIPRYREVSTQTVTQGTPKSLQYKHLDCFVKMFIIESKGKGIQSSLAQINSVRNRVRNVTLLGQVTQFLYTE